MISCQYTQRLKNKKSSQNLNKMATDAADKCKSYHNQCSQARKSVILTKSRRFFKK